VLVQFGFYLQQILVLNIEERRKDHWQMLGHHFITVALMWSCYCYSFTGVGTTILMLMDVADLFLPVSLTLGRYYV
jgi:very-long-chain ceramide synthase